MRYLDIARKAREASQAVPHPALASEGKACPTCGATPEELALVRRKRALDGIMAEYERHLSGCGECGGWAGPWCEAGRALRRRYLDAWLAWQGRGEGVP